MTLILAGLFLASAQTAAFAPFLWGDGFEGQNWEVAWSGHSGSWTAMANSSNAHTGGHYAKVSGGTAEPDELWLNWPSTGQVNLRWSYWYRVPSDGPDAGDSLAAEWSSDSGATWNNLASYGNLEENSGWLFASHWLPEAAGDNPNLVLRTRAEMNSAGDAVWFDDFLLEALPEPATILFCLVGGATLFRRRRY